MGDTYNSPSPFGVQNPNDSFLSGALGSIFGGQSMGGDVSGIESLSYLDQLRAQEIQSQMGMNDKMGLAYDRMGQPPSKWATGAQTFGSIAQGIAGLGNIYLGLQGMKQQKKAFEFNKGVVNTNLNNSISDYNRRLGDTLTNRALNNGQSQGWVSSELAKYSAKRS